MKDFLLLVLLAIHVKNQMCVSVYVYLNVLFTLEWSKHVGF